MLFHKIDQGLVVVYCNGVYKQCDLYRRGNDLYAKWGSGFIGIRTHGTTHPKAIWDHIEGVEWEKDALGRVKIKDAELASSN